MSTKKSAENLFSLPICVIMGLTKNLPCVKGGGSRRLTEGLVLLLIKVSMHELKEFVTRRKLRYNPSVANATAPTPRVP